MADNEFVALERRSRPRPIGRPKAPEPGSAVTTWLRQSEHDRLIRLANKYDTSVSTLVRRLLVLRLPTR